LKREAAKDTHLSRVACAFLLLILLTSTGSASDPNAGSDERGPGAASTSLAVSVSETPDAILLRIQASGDVEPDSVEVRFAGRETVVLARDADGRRIRSRHLRLPEPVIEEGASAAYDADGALVMTFRKQATAEDAGSAGDPEAAAR
jgi:HSP20 family molecular chaperone IbpA